MQKLVVNAKNVALAVLSVLFAASLSGCNLSDTVTETIYEQNPENEVDDTRTILVNDPNATVVSDTLPKLVTSDTDDNEQDTTADLPRYGGDTSEMLTAKPTESTVEDDQTTDNPSQADSNPDTSTVIDDPGEQETEQTGEGSAGNDTSSKSSSKKGRKKGSKGKGKGSSNTTDDDAGRGDKANKKGKNPDAEGKKPDKTGKGKKNEKNEVKVYEDYGEFPEIPEDVQHVTAVGQAAVIVSMLGGAPNETPLVGADADFVNDEWIQKVLENKGALLVKSAWEGDGTSEGDLEDVQDIIDLDPDLCFVTEGEATFTEEQENALLDENIIVYVLPDMSKASKIVQAVTIVGDILEAGGNEKAGDLAEQYEQMHEDFVKDMLNRNQGMAGGYDYENEKTVDSSATSMYSLFISDWDYDARYQDPSGFLSTPRGVGVADVGFSEHPVSYYMSVGGVSNTAACGDFRKLGGQSAPVWQFSCSQAPCTWDSWSYIDRSKVSYELRGNGFSLALLYAGGDGEGYGLGTDSYPGVIVDTSKMREAMLAQAQKEGDVYYAYPVASSSKGGVISSSMVGYNNGSSLVASSIGMSGKGAASVLNDGSGNVEPYHVYVNPHGLFCDWAAGSVESFLEAGWVYKTFRNEDYDLDSEVKAFYRDFYDYGLSQDDLDAIGLSTYQDSQWN